MKICRTILGEIPAESVGITLPHEHICCYYENFYKMLGSGYLDKEKLAESAANHLKHMKEKHNLSTFIDCTPVNIGRDLDLLKTVSEKSGVNIVASTGFYYTEECMLTKHGEEYFTDLLLKDIKLHNIGMLKFAVQTEEMSAFSQKLLSALCQVQKITHLPLIVHTNACVKNGIKVADFVLSKGVSGNAVTIAHCSDTEDMDYVAEIAARGCFTGFDRIYRRDAEEYYKDKARDLMILCEKGYADSILLSHDALTFSEFDSEPIIKDYMPYGRIFTHLIPKMKEIGFTQNDIDKFTIDNPRRVFTEVQ